VNTEDGGAEADGRHAHRRHSAQEMMPLLLFRSVSLVGTPSGSSSSNSRRCVRRDVERGRSAGILDVRRSIDR
jgi:hypothetical protein